MGGIVSVIVDYENNPFMNKPIFENKNSYELVVNQVKKVGVPYYVFSTSEKEKTHLFNGDLNSLLKSIEKNIPSYEHILFFHSDMPIIDIGLINKMISSHLENISDYTFAEHYPEGLTPFIINKGTFKKMLLVSTGNNEPYHYKSIEKLINLDINAYDVEIIISPDDLRFIRDVFRITNKRSFHLVQTLLNQSFNIDKLHTFFKHHPRIVRQFPTYRIVEITGKNNQKSITNPVYGLNKELKTDMSLEQFKKIMNELNEWCENGVIEMGGVGEPFMHPEIGEILKLCKAYPAFQFFIETNGTLLKPFVETLSKISNISIIININSPEKNLYKKIHGTDDFDLVEESIALMFEKLKNRVYLQITRMNDNEQSLDKFLERWRVYQDQLIIKKYNSYGNHLADRKVVDLAPLTRFACWKNQREMFIHCDGSISLCSQDFNKESAFGNIKSTKLKEIWQELNAIYSAHWQENYPKICQNCDEWYIFSL